MISLPKIRLTFFVLMLSILLPLLPLSAHAEEESAVRITIGQELQQWDQSPFILQGNTMVPMRALFEKLGFTVDWDQQKQAATATRGSLTLTLTIQKSTAIVNGTVYYLEVAPVLQNGSTFMPLRFVSEAAGADVSWNEADRSVQIGFDPDPQKRIRSLIENITRSGSFIQNAMVITSGDGIKTNDVSVNDIAMAPDGASAKVKFQADFTVSQAAKTGTGVTTISPSETAIYEFTCEVFKDGAGQWLPKGQPASMNYVLIDKKPFMGAE